MRAGTYNLKFKLYDDEDNVITVTRVRYYTGFRQTLEEPGEPASVTIEAAEDEDGVEIEELDELNDKHWEDVEEAWNDYYREGRV